MGDALSGLGRCVVDDALIRSERLGVLLKQGDTRINDSDYILDQRLP